MKRPEIINAQRIPWAGVNPQPPANEIDIVWLEDPSQYFFVRTMIFNNQRRSTKPASNRSPGKLIGYSVLSSDVKQTKWDWLDTFRRRLFYLTERDLREDCIYLKENFHPSEGVDPLTVAPGIWGVHLQPLMQPFISLPE